MEYNHTQASAASTWTINHNLGVEVQVSDVIVNLSGTLTKILPGNVVHTNNNTLTITFSSSYSGYARVVA